MLHRSWIGRRISVRCAVSDRTVDVVGDLLELDAHTASVATRDGIRAVDVTAIVAARLVEASTADILALEGTAARGWRPAETEELDGWVLRANGGFTGRANSVLPLRQLRRPLDEALTIAAAWYHERGLPLRFQVPTEARRLLDAELGERGWEFEPDVHVLAARLDVLDTTPGAADLADEPDEQWLANYRPGHLPSHARDLLVRHDTVTFASVRRGGVTVAIGRGVVDDGWLGVSAVEVHPDHRREGLATQVMRTLWSWGREQGADRSYLQVSSDNPALALYERLGYWQHHDYRYRVEPVISET